MKKGLVVMLLSLPVFAFAATDLMLNINTEDCQGNTGIAVIEVDKIHRTVPYQCGNGGAGKNIMQLLVESKSKSGSYDVYYITKAESKRIDAEVAKILESQKKGLERKHTIEIQRD